MSVAELSMQQALDQQLQAAREEAELTLEQLHLVQEELEVYFLKAQDLEEQLKIATETSAKASQANAGLIDERDQHKAAATKFAEEAKKAAKQRDALSKQIDALTKEREGAFSARDAAAAENKQLRSERNKLAAQAKDDANQRDALSKQIDALTKEHEGAFSARDAAAAENKQLRSEYDKLSAEAKDAAKQRDAANKARDQAVAEREAILAQDEQNSDLLKTAQRMLDGQARYLEDLSLKEERADNALELLRLLEDEIRYYIGHTKPTSTMNPDRVQRLVEIAKRPMSIGR